jgi:hypothetical protein
LNRVSVPAVPNFAVYRARPLNGIAFSAPYGHNGAWPTLRDVLEVKRPETFPVRPYSFDTKRVGLDVSKLTDKEVREKKVFIFDTSKPGNGSGGHDTSEYGTDLSPGEKDAIVEYLKSI